MAITRSGKYGYGYNSKYLKDQRPWKNKSKTELRKKVSSYIWVLVVSLITVFALLFNALFLSFFNNSKISNALCTPEMYTLVQTQAKENFAEILNKSNIPESTVSNILNSSYISSDMQVFIGNSDGIFDKFDVSSRQKILRSDLEKYYTSNNIKITPALSKEIDSITDDLLEAYAQAINLPLWPRFLEVRYSVSTYTLYLEFIFLAIIAVPIIRLKLINKKYNHRFFRYIYHYAITTTISLVALSALLSRVNLNIGVKIDQQQYSLLFNSLMKNYRSALIIFAVFMLAVGIASFVSSYKARKQLIWNCSHKHLSKEDAELYHKELADYIESGYMKKPREEVSQSNNN